MHYRQGQVWTCGHWKMQSNVIPTRLVGMKEDSGWDKDKTKCCTRGTEMGRWAVSCAIISNVMWFSIFKKKKKSLGIVSPSEWQERKRRTWIFFFLMMLRAMREWLNIQILKYIYLVLRT